MTPPHHSPKAPSSTPSDGIRLRAHAARAWVRLQSGQPLNSNPPRWCKNKAQCRFYTNLLKGTIRYAQPLLSELNTLSPRKNAKRQPEALALALLGLYQLRFLRLPPHAVLHQTVAAAALLNRKWAKPWINAVLRHALQSPPPTAPMPLHPSWLLQRWEKYYGADRTQQISQAQSHWYGAAVAVHPRRGSLQQLLQQLQQEGISASIHPHWPLALHLENLQPLLLSKTFASGAVWVQDTSSQILTTLIQPLLQGPTLDLCCAPGGKLMALATAANPPPFLLGIDIHHQRLLQTQNNLKKILPHHIPLIQADASKPLPVSPTHPWHTIILDAPCSSTGVLAKHPDALHRLSPQHIQQLAQQQKLLLQQTVSLCPPQSWLVYITCSIEPEENQWQINAFTQQHPFQLHSFLPLLQQLKKTLSCAQAAEHIIQQHLTPQGHLLLLPSKFNHGLFAALLQRK